jgi:hypothetical protein
MRKFLFVFIVLALPYTTVIAQNLTIEQKAKIFWQGFVNSYKKNNNVNVDKFDPEGVKVDWPIAFFDNYRYNNSSLDNLVLEVVNSEDYHTQTLDNKTNESSFYQSNVEQIILGGKLIKIYKFSKESRILFGSEELKKVYSDFFISKYNSFDDIYVITDINIKNGNDNINYYEVFLKYDVVKKSFKVAAICQHFETGD